MAWLTADFESKQLHMPVSMDILMPQGHGNYKSIYLLHGAGGDRTSWLLKTRIADYVEGKNIAVIMPSGDNAFYVNNRHGKDYMDFISIELVELCSRWFALSTKKEDRAIAGMSMGGYGALIAALNFPELYGKAASFSGLLDIVERYDHPQGLDLYPAFGEREELINSSKELFHLVVDNYNKKINGSGQAGETQFTIECGLQDSRMEMSQRMYKHMKQYHYPVTFHSSEGGHDWTYWDACIQRFVNQLV